jgi:hypothetical protein
LSAQELVGDAPPTLEIIATDVSAA